MRPCRRGSARYWFCLCSFPGGSTATYSTHWLDTLKVKMQTFPTHYASTTRCLTHTLHNEGVRGLYQVSALGEINSWKGRPCIGWSCTWTRGNLIIRKWSDFNVYSSYLIFNNHIYVLIREHWPLEIVTLRKKSWFNFDVLGLWLDKKYGRSISSPQP